MNHRPHNLVKRLASICILAILTLQTIGSVPVAQAATPDTIVQYQGRLLNANGVPVAAASASILFEFYDDAVAGTCLWSNSSSTCATTTPRTVTLTDGLFSEPLGNTTIGVPYAAIPESVFGDNTEIYLRVTVNSEVLSPRKRVLTSPYATNSSLLDGLDTTTTGATDSAIPALDANGALVITGNPGGSGVGQGSLYLNPAALDSAANDTIFGIADGGTELFRVDKEGDVFIGGVALNATSGTAGASLVGVDSSAFTQSSETDVQAVLLDFDTVINGLAGGTSKWTDSGTFTYLTGTSDDLVIGSTAAASASFFFDESAGVLSLGTDSSLDGGLTLYSSGGTEAVLAADASGNLDLTAALLDLTGDIRVEGGDFTSSSTTFNFLDAAASSSNIDIGGVTTNLINTINIATNATSADTVTIGNNNASTLLTITGGNDWAIQPTGDATFYTVTTASDINAGGNLTATGYLEASAGLSLDTDGTIFSNDTTFDFLDATGASSTIDIGGVDFNVANTVNIATNATLADTITIGNSNASTQTGIYGGTTWEIQPNGDSLFVLVETQDLSVTAGEILSSSDVNLFDDATATGVIDIGGVTTDLSNQVLIATEDTSSDIIIIGNSNAATIMELVGGNDWSISQAGSATFLDVSADILSINDIGMNGGDFTSNGSVLNFLDGGGSTAEIHIGGVDNSVANVISLATNSTAADTLTFGNSHASTLFTLTGGNDWSILPTGDATFESVSVADSSGLLLNPYGTNPGEASGLYFFEVTGAGSHAVGFKAPDSISGDTTWTLPSADGSSGDYLTTDGFGVLSWATPGGVTADSLDFTEFNDSLTLDATLNVTAGFNTVWNLTSAGDFEIHDNGVQVFSIDDSGSAIFNDSLDINQDTVDGEFIDIDVSHTTDTSINPFHLSVTNTAPASTATNYMMLLTNANDGGGATGTFDTFLRLANNDSNESVGIGLELVGSGGYGTGISLSDTSITTGIDLGNNDIIGSAAVIDFDDFDVDASGNVTANDFVCSGCLDYDAFDFQLNLDESTDLALGSFQYNVELDSTGGYYFNMLSTGDVSMLDNGSPFAVFNNGGLVDFNAITASSDFIDIDASVVNVATGVDISANGLTSGVGLQVGSTSGALTNGSLSNIYHSGTYTSAGTITGYTQQISRTINNNSGGVLTTTGAVLSVSSSNTNTSGTLTDTAPVGEFRQNNTAATGESLYLYNLGTGSTLEVDQRGNTGSTVSDGLGGALHVRNSLNDDYGLTVYSDNASTTNALAYVFADNTSFDNHVYHVRNDSTQTNSSAVRIEQNTISDSSSTTNFALLVDTNETAGNDELVVFRSDADGTPDIEFRFESDGDAFADGSFTGGGADLAEWMISSDPSLGGTDVVCRDESTLNGVKECAPGETSVIGAISTNPGFVGNYQESFDNGIPANYRLVGLVGQIDVSASAADGAIAVGDLVTTSSSVAGAVGKASGPSRVLGYALEPLAAGSGVIKVMVQPTWSAEGTITSDGSAIVMRETFALASLATANSSANYGSELLSFRGSAWNGSSAQSVAMGLEAMVDSVSAYRLAVTNTAGTEVASINQSGDLSLAGRFYPSDSGAMQNSAYIYYDSSGLGYMRTNAAGWSTGSYDFAEMFPSPDALVPGELVVFGTGREQMIRSTGKKYDDRIAGIVSTRPGFLAGEWRDGEYPVALSGRVPTFVSAENGAIKVGDPLTTSSKPGYAMKATQAGPIVGYAMEDHALGDGSIIVFVRASYYDGATTNVAPAADTAISGLSSSTVATLDITGTLNMNGGGIFSVGSIQGAGGTWSISGNGDIETEGRLVQLVRSYQNENVETYAATSREMTIQLSGTATLQNGTAVISLESVDPKFNDIISTETPYRVFVTPNGATGQISVTNREQASFVIRDTSGANGVLVDWLVIGTHKDYVPSSLPVVTEPELPEVPPDNLPEEEMIEGGEAAPDAESEDPEVSEITEEVIPPASEEIVPEVEEGEPAVEETIAPIEDEVESGEELIDELAEVTP